MTTQKQYDAKLLKATLGGDETSLAYALSPGANLEVKDKGGYAPARFAFIRGHTQLSRHIESCILSACELAQLGHAVVR